MHADLVSPADLGPGEVAAWELLASRSAEPNPMNEPAFVLPAASHLPTGATIRLAVARERGTIVGALPVRRASGHGNLRIPCATTDIRRMTYLGTPLLDRDHAPEAARCLLGCLAGSREESGWSVAVLKWMSAGSVVEQSFRRAAADLSMPVVSVEEFDQPMYARTRDEPLGHVSARHRSDYARRERRLAEQLGQEVRLVDRSADERAPRRFIDLEAAGYKLSQGVAMRSATGEPEAFAETCSRLASAGRLCVLALESGPTTIAMQVSVAAGDGLFLLKVSHDERFSRFAPGVLLHLRAIEHLSEAGLAGWIRACTYPGNDLLSRLYPGRAPTTTLVVGLGGAIGDTVVRALPRLRPAVGRVRELAGKLHR